MIPFAVRFIVDQNNAMTFQSNEKPIKGDIYSIQDASGNSWEAKITEVSRVVITDGKGTATLEYRCKLEKHEDSKVPIGFGKRN